MAEWSEEHWKQRVHENLSAICDLAQHNSSAATRFNQTDHDIIHSSMLYVEHLEEQLVGLVLKGEDISLWPTTKVLFSRLGEIMLKADCAESEDTVFNEKDYWVVRSLFAKVVTFERRLTDAKEAGEKELK